MHRMHCAINKSNTFCNTQIQNTLSQHKSRLSRIQKSEYTIYHTNTDHTELKAHEDRIHKSRIHQSRPHKSRIHKSRIHESRPHKACHKACHKAKPRPGQLLALLLQLLLASLWPGLPINRSLEDKGRLGLCHAALANPLHRCSLAWKLIIHCHALPHQFEWIVNVAHNLTNIVKRLQHWPPEYELCLAGPNYNPNCLWLLFIRNHGCGNRARG